MCHSCVELSVSYYTCLISQFGDTPLMKAASRGHSEVVGQLLKSGATVDLQDIVCHYRDYHVLYCQLISEKCVSGSVMDVVF